MSAEKKDALQLQDRDLALLRGLFECRVMTTKHIVALYFDGKREYTKTRLRQLKIAGLISERRRKVYEPAVLFLTRKGLLVLQEHGILEEYPKLHLPDLDKRARVSELTLRHELEIMDVRVAFHSALARSKVFSIEEFVTWPLLYQFEASRHSRGTDVLVKPDGFIRIHEKELGTKGFAHEFFLELDRSSETQDTLIARAVCYRDFFSSGGFAERNGAHRSEFKDFPFRVLMVFKTAERRNNTAERLLQNNPPILTQVCLGTFDEVTADPLGAVWFRPIDYREATKGTPFDPEKQGKLWGYKRQTARELFVEKKVPKLKILADDTNA